MAIRLEPPGSGFLSGDQTNRARLLHREHRENEALSATEAGLAADPEFLDAHSRRINVLRKLKRHSEVIRSCDVLLPRGKPSGDLYELGAGKTRPQGLRRAIEDNTLAHAMKPRIRGDPGTVRQALPSLRRSKVRVARFRRGDQSRSVEFRAPQPTSAGMARASLGFIREAVVDASAAVSLGKPTDETLYSAHGSTGKLQPRRPAKSRRRVRPPRLWRRAIKIRCLSCSDRQSPLCRPPSARISCAMSFKLTPRWRPFAIAFGIWIWQGQRFLRKAQWLKLKTDSGVSQQSRGLIRNPPGSFRDDGEMAL